MELHWDKFQLLAVNGEYRLTTPSGQNIPPKDSMTYLGATIYADGSTKLELNRKLRAAWANFAKLNRLWKHASLARSRKLEIFQAVVLSRLLYGLSSAWLNVADIRKLNGFHCRCLRVIQGVLPAYVSRVSNTSVLAMCGKQPLAAQLRKQQMLLYRRVVRAPQSDSLRRLTFVSGTFSQATGMYIRKVGRPRNEWAFMMQKECLKMHPHYGSIVHHQGEWKRAVNKYCDSLF